MPTISTVIQRINRQKPQLFEMNTYGLTGSGTRRRRTRLTLAKHGILAMSKAILQGDAMV
jgi:hypothetical protein